MAEQHRSDDLTQLRATVTTLQAEVSALRARVHHPRRAIPRRLLPLALVALLMALLPLSILAANPVFSDLDDAATVHQPNIQAIGNAGITTGFDDPAHPGQRTYNPKGLVTREEMASFLARTAGLGSNPPVVNALTATNATNAATLGGQPPSAYLPSTGDIIYRYSGSEAIPQTVVGTTVNVGDFGERITALPAYGSTAVIVALPHATTEFGRFLAAKSARVCYRASAAGIRIDRTDLNVNERGSTDQTELYSDNTARTATTATCYDIAVGTPRGLAGQTYLYLKIVNDTNATHVLTLYSFALTLTPLDAGPAEVPGGGSGGHP